MQLLHQRAPPYFNNWISDMAFYMKNSILQNSSPENLQRNIELGQKDVSFCICECILPVYTICQYIGITPAKFVHKCLVPLSPIPAFISVLVPSKTLPMSISPCTNSPATHQCILCIRMWNLPSLINLGFIFSFFVVTVWVLFHIDNVLKVYFNGTDLYTFGLQVELLYLQACGILLNALLTRRKLQYIWTLIQKVYIMKDINRGDNQRNVEFLKHAHFLKRLSFGQAAVIVFSGILYAIYFLYFVFRWCFLGPESELGNLVVKPPCPFSDGFLFLQKISYSILILFNMGFAAKFSSYCGLLWLLNKDIGWKLKQILRNTSSVLSLSESSNVEQLEKLRIGHEILCKISRLIGACFGLPLLLICVSSLLSITCAVYTGALRIGIFNVDEQKKIVFEGVSGFYFLSIIHGFIALIVLTIILISGQVVQNSAVKPAEIIGQASHINLSPEEKHEVTIFLQKIATSPTGIWACSVTKISVSFLAAAATNVTTYILVILQFRLGVEPAVDAADATHQKSTNDN